MTGPLKALLAAAIAATGILVMTHAGSALHAALPSDMPADASFLQSGYNLARSEPQGSWVACRMDPSEDADWCRVTDPQGMVVYQGAFLPYNSPNPVPQAELKITQADPREMFVRGPAEAAPVPVIPLTNGKLLVPAADQYALQQRWSNDPSELRRLMSY